MVDPPGRFALPPGEAVLASGWALVRVHVAVDAVDGRPLRRSDRPEARLLAVVAGTGPVALTTGGVAGLVRAGPDRPAVAYAMAWREVDDVGPAASGGVRLLSTTLLGGLTLDLVRWGPTTVD